MPVTATRSSVMPIGRMAIPKQMKSARSFMENVTGLPLLSYEAGAGHVVVHVSESTDRRIVPTLRDPITIGLMVEVRGVRQIAAPSHDTFTRLRLKPKSGPP